MVARERNVGRRERRFHRSERPLDDNSQTLALKHPSQLTTRLASDPEHAYRHALVLGFLRSADKKLMSLLRFVRVRANFTRLAGERVDQVAAQKDWPRPIAM